MARTHLQWRVRDDAMRRSVGLLASLAGKSLVQVQVWRGDPLCAAGTTVRRVRRMRGWPPPARQRHTPGCWAGRLERARSAEAAPAGRRAGGGAGPHRISVDQASIRAALTWALWRRRAGGGTGTGARLARWWIATGRPSEAGRVPDHGEEIRRSVHGRTRHPGPGAARRGLVDRHTTWVTSFRGPPRLSPTASSVPGRPPNCSWKPGAATCWPPWPGTCGRRPDEVIAELHSRP